MRNALLHLRRWIVLIAFLSLIMLGLVSTLVEVFQDAQRKAGYGTPASAVKPTPASRGR